MTAMSKDIELLRLRAEAALVHAPNDNSPPPQDMVDAMRLVEELRVYQTELEIQNQDLKAAQLQTEVAMRKYKRLFENLPLEGMIVDSQGFIVEANAVARTRFSLRQQTALQRRSVYQVFSLESRSALHAALGSKQDVALAQQCQLATGNPAQPKDVDALVIALEPDSFMPGERLMVLVDRTFEHQLAIKHEEVSRSEERYRTLFDRSKVPMLLVDPGTGSIVRGNTAAHAFYGFEGDGLLGRLISDVNIMTPEQIAAEMQKALSEKRQHFYFAHRLANGDVLDVEVHSGPIEIDGKILLYSIVHDITERVQAQQRADATHALLTNLAAQVPGFIYQFQTFADGRSSFPYASPGIEAIYEVSAEQVVADASAIFSRLHPQDYDRVAASIAESSASLTPWVCEYRVALPVQGERWRRGIAKPERRPDGSTLWHGFIADITDHKIAEERLEEFNRDFEAFLDQTSDFVYFKDRASRFRFCSQALATICSHSNWRDMRGKHDREVFPLETALIYEREEAPVFAQGIPLLNKIDPYFDAQGRSGFVHTNKWPLFDQNGQVTGIFGISRDVTEIRLNQSRLQLAANVFTYAREGIMITDPEGRIVEVNAALTRITGYERSEVIGQNPRVFKSGRQNPEFYQGMWESLNVAGHWEGEIWNRRKSGEIYAQLQSISAVRDSDGRVINYVALFSDISLQKAHELELEHIARYDCLTGLPNRSLLADRLQQTMAHCLRQRNNLAVVFVDLDGFKQINDSHGHDVGDRLLVALSQRMKMALRDGDTLSRIGGDEFVAVLTGMEQPRDCEIVLARILNAASEPVTIDHTVVHLSASIGVTLYPHDSSDADQLIRHADHAMYQAKQAGKNRYHYFDVVDDLEVKSHRESLDQISKALDLNEFVLHYQPKVNMKTGAVVGLEALIRWQHPLRGMVYPNEFLSTFKDRTLSVKLGDWVLQAAVRQMADWIEEGLDISVSVNIDAVHLQQPGFVTRLREILARYPKLKAKQLDLEMLESSALNDMEKVIEIMRDCAELGVGFSLDDFGTGYSSLTYLKRLPAELMKIDQSFVIGMVQYSDDFVIVEGVVSLARAFGRNVLAEGVETVAHGELLLALGCHMGQGYGIAKAMPASQVAQWIETWRPDPSWTVWNTSVQDDDTRDLVLASIKHRHWIRDVENYVTGKSDLAPPLDVATCQFGRWLDERGHARFAHHPAYDAMLASHRSVHAVAEKLVHLFECGMQRQAAAGLTELNRLRNHLISDLHKLAEQSEAQVL
jgi:diguanylate cyclase (GGDEF)-like protein/PAS domain S-box-containing protein